MGPRTHRLNFPLSRNDALGLRAGDQVVMDGEIIVTAGLPTHQRLLRCLDGEETPPMDLHGASVFHLGSFSREVAGRLELLYLNPTTSTRFNPYMPRLLQGFGWHAVGGKGGLDATCAQALQQVGGVYLSFLGGGCTLLSQAVTAVLEVGWSDMLMHYRLVRLRVQGLGPTTVAIDAHGRSLYDEEHAHAQQQREHILEWLAQQRQATHPQTATHPRSSHDDPTRMVCTRHDGAFDGLREPAPASYPTHRHRARDGL